MSNRFIFSVSLFIRYEAKFQEFEPRLKYETRFKHGWFHLNCIKCFKIWACAQFEPVFGGSATRFKFLKFGLRSLNCNVQWEPETCGIGRRHYNNTFCAFYDVTKKTGLYSNLLLNHLLREKCLFTLHNCSIAVSHVPLTLSLKVVFLFCSFLFLTV